MCNIRHGDLGLIGIDNLPEGLTLSNTNILMKGNHGHNHTCDNGEVYIIKDSDTLPEGEFIFGYLVAKNTTLYHEDHGELVESSNIRIVKIPDGIYQLVKQVEYTPDGMKPVID